jgi:uncharacterized protein YkwD
MHNMQRSKRTRLLIATATIVIGALALVACGPAPGPASAAASDVRARTDYLRLINGRNALGFDGYLEGNAQLHADRLANGASSCNNLWHSGEMGSWYAGSAWGENVACVPGCPNRGGQVLGLWWHSPGHQANLLNPAFGLQGVGVACNGAVEMVVAHYRSP